MRASLLVFFLLFSAPGFGAYVYIVNTSGNGKCWPIKNYAEMKKVMKVREPGRLCVEDKKTQIYQCAGAGDSPSQYTYYEVRRDCERKRAGDERASEDSGDND